METPQKTGATLNYENDTPNLGQKALWGMVFSHWFWEIESNESREVSLQRASNWAAQLRLLKMQMFCSAAGKSTN